MHNKHLGGTNIRKYDNLDELDPEKYGSQKYKPAVIQALNTILFYDLTRKNIISEISIFADIVFNYDLFVHSITSLSLQRVDVSREPILCTFTTIQNMNH